MSWFAAFIMFSFVAIFGGLSALISVVLGRHTGVADHIWFIILFAAVLAAAGAMVFAS